MKHALIIDDNKSNIDVLGMMLKNEGLSYSEILHPSEVVEFVTSNSPLDVIFLDLEFPTNNGFTLIEKLRHIESLNGVPIIAYSVHTSEIEVARSAGFDGFLAKPLDADQFSGQLQRILSGQPVWEAV